MKHAIIVPASQVRFAEKSDFHLILPHLFEELPEYLEFYASRAKAGDHILVDNSIFELEKSFDYKMMIEYAEKYNFTEISAPEVLRDREASKKVRDEFLEYREKIGSKVKVLAVAQGRNMEEILESHFELLAYSEIENLGLPFDIDEEVRGASDGVKSLTLRRVLNRWYLVDLIEVQANILGIELKPTHLMGLSDPVELQKYTDYPWIRSNDSSSAFVHGVNLVKLTDRGLPGEKIRQKLDFGGYKEPLSLEQVECITHNIEKIQSWIQ